MNRVRPMDPDSATTTNVTPALHLMLPPNSAKVGDFLHPLRRQSSRKDSAKELTDLLSILCLWFVLTKHISVGQGLFSSFFEGVVCFGDSNCRRCFLGSQFNC